MARISPLTALKAWRLLVRGKLSCCLSEPSPTLLKLLSLFQTQVRFNVNRTAHGVVSTCPFVAVNTKNCCVCPDSLCVLYGNNERAWKSCLLQKMTSYFQIPFCFAVLKTKSLFLMGEAWLPQHESDACNPKQMAQKQQHPSRVSVDISLCGDTGEMAPSFLLQCRRWDPLHGQTPF